MLENLHGKESLRLGMITEHAIRAPGSPIEFLGSEGSNVFRR